MKKVFEKIILGAICVMALATIASCDKDGSSTLSGGGITPAGYVDLGLPSGTKWKAVNETKPNDTCDLYTFYEAMEAFGNKLPTKEQYMELWNSCEWSSGNLDTKIVGPNGNYIILPHEGYRYCEGGVRFVDTCGVYWSSYGYSDHSDGAWGIFINCGDYFLGDGLKCEGRSVRLVQD